MAPGNHCSRLFLLSVASSFEWRPLGGEAFVVSRTLQTHPGPALGWCSTSSASRQHARDRVAGLTRLVSNMNAADTAAEAVSGAATAVARHDGSSSAPDSTSEEESFGPEEERNVGKGGGGRRNSSFGTRMLGDVEEDGFTGTRMGYQVLKEYEVPDQAPANLPEGEEEGYPMLIYQFMHAQYRDEFPSQSSSRKAVRRKELLLNGAEVRNDAKVRPGDKITMQKRVQPGLFPQGKPSCKLQVLWEDDYIAVVVKPPGVAVHGGTGEEGDPGPGGRRSVRQALPYLLKPTKSDDRPLHRPLHCHRLDKATGGLLICAKTRPALSTLSDAFEKHLVSKRYVALVAGELEGCGCITTPLDGKTCHTNYRARGATVRSLKTSAISTVDLWPVTGRYHQLRRHLASIGCPILGDRRYTPGEVPFQEGGMYLWAVGLTFPHPITGEEMSFSLPEPEKFEKWRRKEEERWLKHNSGDAVAGEAGSGQGVQADEGPGKMAVNAVPDVEGLQMEERDGFRYYQYDWSVVGGKPTALSTEDIDTALDGAP